MVSNFLYKKLIWYIFPEGAVHLYTVHIISFILCEIYIILRFFSANDCNTIYILPVNNVHLH